ncbi:GbsR/MarR family transcriptional regulator [Catellatospora tritici]|uniref:GbsR/MarR family transcriptional regulator n=1 Tax=Catellatospora tritici TaxID=2851566 RepID=UPI001C2D8808|nr:MarR family transcriptional regulator [Catellatospora tritici]MBV1854197.1 MarR family transcriptional regulator [Catellatospora tritici]
MSDDVTRDEDGVRRSVEHMAMMLADMGFPRMASRVLLTMMGAEESSLSAGDLAERLGVSPAAISGAVKYLMHLGFVVRDPVPGSRRDFYRLPAEPWYGVTLAKRSFYGYFSDEADRAIAAAGGEATVAGERVAQMRDFFRFVENELGTALQRWQEQRMHRA